MVRFLFALAIVFSAPAMAAEPGHPPHHVKHNMVLFGSAEIFASHIVYKEPHNFQVILQVAFDPAVRALYQRERAARPANQLIYLLDPMHIAEIATLTSLKGDLISEFPDGKRVTLSTGVVLPKGSFRLIFFNELPLQLATGMR